MGEQSLGWRGIRRALAAAALASLLAGCVWGTTEPAPVYQKDGMAEAAPGPLMPPPRPESRRIVVRPGQSLRGIAHAYHVPERVIIAANHLRPPYKIEIGRHLLIPGGGDALIQQAALAPLPAAPTVVPLAPLPPGARAPAPMASARSPDIIPLDDSPPARPAAASPMSHALPPAAAPPTSAASLTPPAAAPPVTRPSGEASAADEAKAEPAAPSATAPSATAPSATTPSATTPSAAALPHGGHFPWPVRGHVLAGYGVATGGAHNDGINIAAPRGTPVSAVDAGVVAYAGNELKGYGNLVLIKHANGWITAYAHCDDLLVKRGEKIARGQVIGKVGTTGGVSEPQLHFELRRGKQAVDPKEFLAPTPSAGADDPSRRG